MRVKAFLKLLFACTLLTNCSDDSFVSNMGTNTSPRVSTEKTISSSEIDETLDKKNNQNSDASAAGKLENKKSVSDQMQKSIPSTQNVVTPKPTAPTAPMRELTAQPFSGPTSSSSSSSSGSSTKVYKNCTNPAGGTLTHLSRTTFWNSTASPHCVSEIRSCNNGVLSGSYVAKKCTVTATPATPNTSTACRSDQVYHVGFGCVLKNTGSPGSNSICLSGYTVCQSGCCSLNGR